MELPSYPSTLRNRVFIANVLGLFFRRRVVFWRLLLEQGNTYTFLVKSSLLYIGSLQINHRICFGRFRERSKNKKNIKGPISIDLTSNSFKLKTKKFDAVLNINMIHIAPWEACIGLFKLASEMVRSNGFVYLYGPFKVAGVHTSESNNRFDVSLKERNAAWGVRNMEDVVSLAKGCGFPQFEIHDMPANNKSIIFRKTDSNC